MQLHEADAGSRNPYSLAWGITAGLWWLLYTFEEPHETGAAGFIQLVDTGICQHLGKHLAYLILQDQVDALVRQQTAKRDLMKQVLDEAAQSGFEANSVVTDTTNTRCIAIDAHRRKFLLKPTPGEDYAVYDYADLIDFSLSQDGSTLITGTSGDAFIGSLFMGTTGAVIGAAGPRQLLEFCSDLHIELVLNDTENPRVVLPLISTEMPKSSPEYKYIAERAKEMIALLQIVRSHAQRPQPDRQPVQEAIPAEAREAPDAETAALPAASEAKLAQAAEQVRLYKELFDEGLLTREEFEAKRKELLRV